MEDQAVLVVAVVAGLAQTHHRAVRARRVKEITAVLDTQFHHPALRVAVVAVEKVVLVRTVTTHTVMAV
jgi:hypothetical protein